MKNITVLIFFYALTVFSQNYSREYLNEILNSDEIEFTDYFNETKNFDFSDVWLNEEHQDHYLGFIGKDYQRMYIHFYTIIKNRANNIQYYVRGKTKVKDQIKLFMGSFEILHSKLYITNDNTYKRGFTIASYEFYEVAKLDNSGSFTGVTKFDWYINDSGELCYDNLNYDEEDYSSNFGSVGIWKEYNSDNEFICNFGQYRIPYAIDLDVGVGEFVPAKEYKNNGWEDFFSYSDGGEPDKKWWHEY